MIDKSVRLELSNITRIFDGRAVVNAVSLRLYPGEVVCLLGASGCGKSTTLRIAAGIDRQTRGAVIKNGVVISNKNRHVPAERRGIGLMFQDFALFPHLTVRANIEFGLRYRGLNSKARNQRVDQLLEKVALFKHANKYPYQLSGGEQQRVALARALAPKPSIMLMDEPFSSLDNRLRDGVRDATFTLLKQERTAVLMVTHESEEAMSIANKIALMRDGCIVQIAAPYNIYNAPVDREAAAFFSDINVITARVQGALTETPFGRFLTPGMRDGTIVDIVIRPQHLRIDFDRGGKGPRPMAAMSVAARGLVKRARFIGHHSLIEFSMDFANVPLRATIPGVFLPTKGTPLWLWVRRDQCFVFQNRPP